MTTGCSRSPCAEKIVPETSSWVKSHSTGSSPDSPTGQLIGNSDRHFGNLSFFVEGEHRFRLAPVYDMLPMLFAPVGTDLIERRFEPAPPTADTLDVWPQAARCAAAYWGRLATTDELSAGFRQLALRCQEAVETLSGQILGA